MPRPSWLRTKGKSKAKLGHAEASSSAASSRSNLASGAENGLGNPLGVLQTKAESCKSLWDRAYEDLCNDKGNIVKAFKELLMSDPEIESTTSLDDEDTSKREKRMSALVDKKLAAMNKEQWRFKVGDKSVEVREQVDRIVKVVLVAKDFISSVASIDPIHAGLPWAGVCMLLPLVINDSKQRAAAVDGLEYISKLVRRYAEIEFIYFQREQFALRGDLEAAVVKLYSLVLEYEARAACQFNRNTALQIARNIVEADSWEAILRSVKESETACDQLMRIIEVKDQRTSMKHLEAKLEKQNHEVDKLLKASRIQDREYEKRLLAEVKAGREEQKDWHRSEEESRCYESLRTTDYEFNKDKNPDRVPGTCEWFLQHPRYQNWLDEQASAWLWVTADPGCGKSVLSKFLIDEYKSTKPMDTSICYYFFKDDSEENKSATHALCAILHQLFSQNDALLAHAIPEFKRNRDKLPQLFDTLWSIFTTAIAQLYAGCVICILDALDECAESTRLPLIRKLAGFYSNPNATARLKFIVTSRPNTPIGDAFWRYGQDPTSIQLMGENETEMEAISVEIDLVIKEKVKQFNGLRRRRGVNDDAHIVIQEQLDNIDNRTYLWVSLIFPELEKNAGTPKNKLLKVIKTIPSTVDEAYERILAQSSDVDLAKRLLHIVVVAARPLTILEMNRALSIEVDGDSRSQDYNELEEETSFRTTVRELCGLFVSIKDRKVYLIHQTAKEFLVLGAVAVQPVTCGDSYPTIWKHSLESWESNLVLAKICISYLRSDVFESDPLVMGKVGYPDIEKRVDRYTNEHDFLDYSAKHWATHFRETRVTEMAILESALKVCNTRSKQFMTWFAVYWMTVDSYSQCPQNLTNLMVGSYFGHEAVVKLLLEKGAELEAKDSSGLTPLSWAARSGREAVVKLLLEKGAELDAMDSSDRTPLSWAALYGHEAVVKLLLEKGAELEAKGSSGLTPFSRAALHGREAVVKLLLEKGAELEAKDSSGQTPLSLAAMYGREAVVKLLLEKGAELEAKDSRGRTPLSWAAYYGREAVVKLLAPNSDF